MQKNSLIFLLSLSVVVICLQQLAARQRWEQERRNSKAILEMTSDSSAFIDAGSTLAILENLRAGKTNDAILRLESKLRMDVYELNYSHKQRPERTLDGPDYRELLAEVRAYKQRNPRDSYKPSTDELVVEILSGTNTPTSK
jgi:hypothetical protein